MTDIHEDKVTILSHKKRSKMRKKTVRRAYKKNKDSINLLLQDNKKYFTINMEDEPTHILDTFFLNAVKVKAE